MERVMKIFYNVEPFTAKRSGIPVFALNLVKNIKKLVPDAEICSGAKTINPQIFWRLRKRMEEKFDFPIHFSFTFYPTYLQWPEFVIKRIRKKASDYDIIHILSNILSPSASFTSWDNLVLSIHDGYIFHDEMFPKMFPWQKYMVREMPKQSSLAKKIITGSEYSKKEIVHYCRIPGDKIHVIPDATQWEDGFPVQIDPEFFSSSGIIPNQYFLSVGVLRPNKNYPSLLAGYTEYRKSSSFRGEKLVVVGSHEYPEIAEQLLHTEGVVSIPTVPLQTLKMLYQNAKGFFIVSHMEGFGIPLLEAMQQGCPACYARGTAMDEIGRDAAFSIPSPTDISAIAGMFERFSKGGNDIGKSVENCLKIAKEYSWENTARKTLEVYRQIIEER